MLHLSTSTSPSRHPLAKIDHGEKRNRYGAKSCACLHRKSSLDTCPGDILLGHAATATIYLGSVESHLCSTVLLPRFPNLLRALTMHSTLEFQNFDMDASSVMNFRLLLPVVVFPF